MRSFWTVAVAVASIGSAPLALFGLAQLFSTAISQLVAPAHVTDFLNVYSGSYLWLHEPLRMYDPAAQAALEMGLQGGRHAFSTYFLPPQAAVVLAPLALVPYGASYVVWLAIGVASVVLASCLAAPRFRWNWTWAIWPVALLLYLPLDFGLIMGQSAALMLLGLSSAAWALRSGTTKRWATVLGLLPWTFKPVLLPVHLLALALDRRWWTLGSLATVVLVLAGIGLARTGPGALPAYLALSASKTDFTLNGPDVPNNYAPTILRFLVVLAGPGEWTLVVAALLSVALWFVTAYLWRHGLAPGARAHLQLAMLPLVAVLTALYAGTYELTSWILTAWLLLRYQAESRRHRSLTLGTVLVLWVAGNWAVIDPTLGNRAATLAGVFAATAVAWQFHFDKST